jgi:hypothetical protein
VAGEEEPVGLGHVHPLVHLRERRAHHLPGAAAGERGAVVEELHQGDLAHAADHPSVGDHRQGREAVAVEEPQRLVGAVVGREGHQRVAPLFGQHLARGGRPRRCFENPPLLHPPVGEDLAQVVPPRVREDGHHHLPRREPPGIRDGGRHRGAGGAAHEQALLPGQPPGHDPEAH